MGHGYVMTSAGAHAAQQELDRRRAAEIMSEYQGWRIWTSNAGAKYGTRKGNQEPHERDSVFARTVDADTWSQLEDKLTAQAANDTARGYPG